MATARHLERLLIKAGYSRARLEKGNHALRDAGRLPSAGRGPHAPSISASDAAAIILAYGAAGSPVRAAVRLNRVEMLQASPDGPTLLANIRTFIEEATPFRELLISRIRRRARLVCLDGTEHIFFSPTTPYVAGRAENWWSVEPQLIAAVAALLRGETTEIEQQEEPEDDE